MKNSGLRTWWKRRVLTADPGTGETGRMRRRQMCLGHRHMSYSSAKAGKRGDAVGKSRHEVYNSQRCQGSQPQTAFPFFHDQARGQISNDLALPSLKQRCQLRHGHQSKLTFLRLGFRQQRSALLLSFRTSIGGCSSRPAGSRANGHEDAVKHSIPICCRMVWRASSRLVWFRNG
jgi:hypothetical protein